MELKKPDPNKPCWNVKLPAFDGAAALKSITEGKCPDCGKPVGGRHSFRDQLSREEYGISGLCQKCQNITYDREVS